tara:strand:+ start:276 stop:926 length:651 start_codon:yes stop_codon:yes gene_type:complete
MSKINKNPNHQNFSLLLLAIIFLVCIMATLPWINIDTQKKLLIEGGLFESLTVYGYIFCLILIFSTWSWHKILSKWYFSALIIIFTLRELDYDKAHFTHGVLKSKQYFSDLVGMYELLISIGVLIFILAILASIILREKNSFFKGIKDLKQSQLAVFASIILVIVTKIIDGAERKFGIDLSQSGKQIAQIIEEVGEMGIPIMFAIAILSSRKKKLS